MLLQVAFTLGQITPRKMVICIQKKIFFYFSNGQVYDGEYYALCERVFRNVTRHRVPRSVSDARCWMEERVTRCVDA